MSNSHYVPMLTLRRFNNKLCIFNVKTGKYKENNKNTKIFSEDDFYSSEIEEKFCKKIESQFANLLENKILKANFKIELKRDELKLIKKFLLISIIRSIGSEELTEKESHYYQILNEYSKNYCNLNNIEYSPINPPFKEKIIKNETSFEYWMRTLDVILESDGSPDSIFKNDNKTYPAYRWAQVVNNGYLAFWDSEYEHDEFIITDIGMTSENEKGWNGITYHNVKKTDFLYSLFLNAKSNEEKNQIYQILNLHSNFSENFMMFPISSKRMILLIDPFYKFRIFNFYRYKMPRLDDLTNLTNEKLFYPNDVNYVLNQEAYKPHAYHQDDLYIYNISKLTSKETRYCNELFLDRIDTYVGFSSLGKVFKSLIEYYKDNSCPCIPRNDYTELYEIINERYGVKIDIGSIKGVRR